MTEQARELGEHAARIDMLQAEVHSLRQDVREIRDLLSQARGGWRTMMLLAGAAGAMGALVGKVVPWKW